MKAKGIKQTVLILSLVISCNNIFGQISQGGKPFSFSTNLKSTGASVKFSDNIPIVQMSKIEKSMIESIKLRNKTEYKNQFAYGFDVDIDIKQSSFIDSLDVGLLYRLSVKSTGAYSINLIFKKYILPRGAKLFIYSKDKEYVLGAFTKSNNNKSKRLPTLPVKGEEIIVEYFEPYYTEFEGKLVIGEVNHDFLDVLNTTYIDDDFGSSSSCNIDVNCLQGSNWQSEKRAVCRIIKGGKSHCTGALLNNTDANGIPYFLTANHCIGNQSEADDCVFIFNYESPSCGGGDGSTTQSIAGGTIVSSRAGSDFILLELANIPYATYSAFYAGWDNRNIASPSGVSITHPRGDVKKIAIYNQALTQETYLNSNDWKVTWQAGTVEPGSSGGPLFNNNHRVIGQVHGGNPNDICTTNDHAFFGRFDISWNAGNAASERLRDWLDPNNSNATILDGANVCAQNITEQLNITHTINSGIVEIYQATNTINATNIIKSGATATYEAGRNITLGSGFIAESGSNFSARIRNHNCVPGCYPITIDLLPNVFTPNGDGINDQLCYPVSNATSYEFEAYNRWGSKVYSSSGIVSSNKACVWDGTRSCSGCWYAVIITFRNQCDEKSEAYGVTVFGSNTKSAKYTESSLIDSINSKDKLVLNILPEHEQNSFDFEVFPNPSDGNFVLKIKSINPASYKFEIINSMGLLIYKVEKLNERRIEINKTGFTSGIYYIRLNNGSSIVTKKIIIN